MNGADTIGGVKPINYSYNANVSMSKQNSFESSETISPVIESVSSQLINSMTTNTKLVPQILSQQQLEHQIGYPQMKPPIMVNSIKGVVHSNLPLLPNGQNPNTPQFQNVPSPKLHSIQTLQNSNLTLFPNAQDPNHVAPPVVVQNFVTGYVSAAVNPKVQLQKTRIILGGYFILLISAITVLTIYAVLLTKISPPLDLYATGNWWSFLVLFLSCSITIIVTAFALCWKCNAESPLGQQAVAAISVALAVAFCVVVLAGIGASETSQKKIGQTQITNFGLYVLSVCGNGTTNGLDITGLKDIPKDKINNAHTLDKDKCDAVACLRTSIYLMYIWVAELLIISNVTFILGKFGIQMTHHK